jgi:hypothetical protein
VYSDESQTTFRRNLSPPFSFSKSKPEKVSENEAGTIGWLSLRPEYGGDIFSEMSGGFPSTTRCYIPEDRITKFFIQETFFLLVSSATIGTISFLLLYFLFMDIPVHPHFPISPAVLLLTRVGET